VILAACLFDCLLLFIPVCRLPRPLCLSLFTLSAACLDPLPVTWFTISVLPLLLNKLQMDQHTSESLQKTSPRSDPAAIAQLSSEISAQASQLAVYQHRLTRLMNLTKELVRSLQGLTLQPAEPPPVTVAATNHPPEQPANTVSPRLAFPEKFDGASDRCKGFLLQCSLFVNQQPTLYTTDTSKIAFVCSLLTGKVLEWITAVWRSDGSSFHSFDHFMQHFLEVSERSSTGRSAGEQLLALTQGTNTAAEFTPTFRTLAAQTDWVEDTLKLLYRRGLNPALQTEMACRDEGRSLNEFMDLTIQIDNLVRSRRPARVPAAPAPPFTGNSEPMQPGYTHLTPEEQERRSQRHLCMYCGQSGH